LSAALAAPDAAVKVSATQAARIADNSSAFGAAEMGNRLDIHPPLCAAGTPLTTGP